MTRLIIGDLVLVTLIAVGTYYCLRYIFRKTDRESDAAIKADADGTIKQSRKEMEKTHE